MSLYIKFVKKSWHYCAISVVILSASLVYASDSQPNDVLTRIQEKLKPAYQEFVREIFALIPHTRKHASIISQEEWKELDCDTIVKKFDRTKTIFGPWGLQELSYPIADAQELARRQSIVKKLAHDYYLRNAVQKAFEDIQQAEKDIVAYWDANDKLNASAKNLYYSFLDSSWTRSISDYCNRSRAALELGALVSLGKSSATVALGLGFSGIAMEALDALVNKKDVSLWNGVVNGLKQPLMINSPFSSITKDGFDKSQIQGIWARGTGGDYYQMYAAGMPKLTAALLTLGTIAYCDYSHAENLKTHITNFVQLRNVNEQLFVRMITIARFFRALERFNALTTLYTVFGEIDGTKELSFVHCSAQFQQLVALLKSSTFDSADVATYSRGKVLLAHQLMQDVKDELIPLLRTVAFIDGYYSIAQLYRDQNKETMPFCFPDFVKDSKPHFVCEKSWTPLIPTQTPVLNSFDWHKDTHTKIVFTGPNGCGKSTAMKAIAHTIILGQSWGICPALKTTMRMFTGMRITLSPRENLEQNLSTFMAEKKRIDDITNYMQKFDASDCYFVLLDEPYRGTIESEASYRTNLFAQASLPLDHCMMIMATHLEGPTRLQKETNGIFANYQLGLEEKKHGTFTRTYQVLPGIAEWWFNDEKKRRRFIDQLMQGS